MACHFAMQTPAPASTAGRVPLLAAGTPLLYARYNSVDELLNLGSKALTPGGEAQDAQRPSKKQKRSAATASGADATPAEPAPAAEDGEGDGEGEEGSKKTSKFMEVGTRRLRPPRLRSWRRTRPVTRAVQAEVEAATEAKLARIMAIDSTKDGFVPRRVWVTGIPHEWDRAAILEYWGYCGPLEEEALHLLTFKDSGNFNGTAFITFKTQEGYEAALACNGEMLEGRPLRVEKCKAAAELKGNVAGYPVVYVGNVSFEVGEPELRKLFKERAGVEPSEVRLHKDKNGRPKGFAHVHFANDDDVDKAVALNGLEFEDRNIRISYAQPKPGEAAAGKGGAAAAAGGKVAGYPVVYVGNVSFEVGEPELRKLFKERAGVEPSEVRLHKDKAGRSKGFAHVHFANDNDVDKAVALNGLEFEDRNIRISYAQPKPGEVA
eukprot:XP_001698453.1 predicted protein [Chlamydomonas reinhardtii]